MKVVYLLAGPNGAGKTTFVEHVLRPVLGTGVEFINADQWARRQWPGDEERHAKEASRWAEARRKECLSAGVPFIAETVFSHPSKIDFVGEAQQRGYAISPTTPRSTTTRPPTTRSGSLRSVIRGAR